MRAFILTLVLGVATLGSMALAPSTALAEHHGGWHRGYSGYSGYRGLQGGSHYRNWYGGSNYYPRWSGGSHYYYPSYGYYYRSYGYYYDPYSGYSLSPGYYGGYYMPHSYGGGITIYRGR